jgi:hypothetical protein
MESGPSPYKVGTVVQTSDPAGRGRVLVSLPPLGQSPLVWAETIRALWASGSAIHRERPRSFGRIPHRRCRPALCARNCKWTAMTFGLTAIA